MSRYDTHTHLASTSLTAGDGGRVLVKSVSRDESFSHDFPSLCTALPLSRVDRMGSQGDFLSVSCGKAVGKASGFPLSTRSIRSSSLEMGQGASGIEWLDLPFPTHDFTKKG